METELTASDDGAVSFVQSENPYEPPRSQP